MARLLWMYGPSVKEFGIALSQNQTPGAGYGLALSKRTEDTDLFGQQTEADEPSWRTAPHMRHGEDPFQLA